MTIPTEEGFDLDSTYIHMSDDRHCRAIPVDDHFWDTIDSRSELQDGRLLTVFHFREDWPHWEMHPEGDEVVYLLNGAVDLILDEGGKDRIIGLRGRSAAIVPAGVWHRARVFAPSDTLFITRGQGTQHRPV